MKYSRKATKPRYLTVAEELRNGIYAGKWNAGDLLPSEAQLSRQFGVSRGTAVRAIDVLAREGLVQRRQGVGTFVSRPALHRTPGYLLGFSETVRRQGRTPTHRLVNEKPLTRAESLQFGCGEPAVMYQRVRLVDGVPWAIHNALVPVGIAESIPALSGDDKQVKDPHFSLYRAFDDAGIVIHHADETINVRLATESEADLLQVDMPLAVMLVHRKSYGDDDRLIELIEAVYLEQCYTFDARLVRGHGITGIKSVTGTDWSR